jgi:hypothetical protein
VLALQQLAVAVLLMEPGDEQTEPGFTGSLCSFLHPVSARWHGRSSHLSNELLGLLSNSRSASSISWTVAILIADRKVGQPAQEVRLGREEALAVYWRDVARS